MPTTDESGIADSSDTSSDGSIAHDLPPKKILVVNDTQEILELFDDLLTSFGHQVTLMSFAPNELDRIKQSDPDLIIIDFILGSREMDGWQLVQKLKMDRDTERVPIIVCTAAVHEVREQEGYLTGQGIVVLLKPFSIDQLGVALEKVFALNESAMGTTRPDNWAEEVDDAKRDDSKASAERDGDSADSGKVPSQTS